MGTVERHHEAEARLVAPGDAAVVDRGRLRSLVLRCPDGCGDTLSVNLDPRAGAAWRLYDEAAGLSVFPSVRRLGGCRSHFIVWRGRILWCSRGDDAEPGAEGDDAALDAALLAALSPTDWRPFEQLAGSAQAVPWEVLWTCRRLVREGKAVEGAPGHFRLRGP
ncbi:MAG: DUF6527 family protein [Polyangiales bacterium]